MSALTRLSLILILFLVPLYSTGAGVIDNSNPECADVLMLFARGSSSNPNALNVDRPFSEDFENGIPELSTPEPDDKIGAEEIPGSFFRWMEKRIIADYPHVDYKAISVHYAEGKGYSQHGYPAVGIFNPDTVGNAIQARFSWYEAGEYNDSVSSGSQELAGHIRDNVINCPNQRIVVGGYSQGAQVVHETLKITTQSERNLIDNVVLFGDPKFISSDGNALNPFDVHAVYPWVRGTAALKERGLGGAQVPYVPDDMWYKTISWCHEDDFVCTGLSGLSWSIQREYIPGNALPVVMNYNAIFGAGHKRYPDFGVPEATGEVINNLHSHLSKLEAERGGIDPIKNPYIQFYDASVHNDRPIDVMMAFNYTGGNEDAQAQYFLKLKDITKTYKKNFTGLNTGGAVYTDLAGDSSNSNRAYVAGLARPMNQLSDNLDNAFKGNVIYPTPPGGGDYPENHGMMIERAGMFAGWRKDAIKHLVIFAERPAHESYRYNMCESNTINSLPHLGVFPCATGNQFVTKDAPEWCVSVIEALADSTCEFKGTYPTTLVSRSLTDAVTLARAKGFVFDIVQPHTARNNQPGYSPEYVEGQFKALSESTGGLYLKYDVFDEPAMRDAMWKILNHQPKLMSMSQHTPGSLLNFNTSKLNPIPILGKAMFNSSIPTLVTTTPVSGAQSYGWDFTTDGVIDHVSAGPVAEHTFLPSQNSLVTVKAFSAPNATVPISANVVIYDSTESLLPTYSVESIDSLNNVTAYRDEASVQTEISWDVPVGATEYGFVVISDPVSGAILQTVPVDSGQTLLDSASSNLIVQYVDNGSEAEPQVVNVTIVYPAPDPKGDVPDPEQLQETDNPQETEDPTDIIVDELPIEDLPAPDEMVVDPEPTQEPTDNTGEVGLNNNKTVTQDEPNTTEDPNSPAIDNTPEPVAPQSATTQTFQQSAPQITSVAGDQDVKTNPQSEVGGIEEANQLFANDEIGKQAEIIEEKGINWGLIIGLLGILATCLIFGILILKKKKDEDES